MQNSHESKNTTKEDDGGDHRKSSTKVLSKTTIPKTRTNTSLKIDHSKDKELINSGLHKLVSSFNATKVCLKPSKTAANKKNEKLPLSACGSMPDKQVNSHITVIKRISIDKYTMTDFKESERKIDMETSVLNEQPFRDLQWTDPRLLKKYSLVQPFKKSTTIPYVNKCECGSEIVERTSDDEAEIFYAENKHFLFRCLYYICTTSMCLIGSVCGITLITMVLWKMIDEDLFNFHLEPPKDDLFLRTIIRGVMSLTFELINNICGKVLRLLTISTSEVFAPEQEFSSVWYQKLF